MSECRQANKDAVVIDLTHSQKRARACTDTHTHTHIHHTHITHTRITHTQTLIRTPK